MATRSAMITLHLARPTWKRLAAAAAAFVLPALLLGGLMSVGSAEAEPAVEHQPAPAVPQKLAETPHETPPAAPQKVEAGKSAPPLVAPPVLKKPRKHRLLPVRDFGGY